MIGQTVSHYRILDRLGEGGMGTVYLAEDMHLGRRVALKFLTSATRDDHHFRARFLREARSTSALSHPNIATIYDYGETSDGQPFIVMEYIHGRMLSDLLSEGRLLVERAVEIIEDTAEALAEAHRRGVIHRDIKPSNVAIAESGEVKVLDFGLAKQLNYPQTGDVESDAETLLTLHTQIGAIVGTPMYLSPEQAKGAGLDHRSDLFALGTLLYECVAGRLPFAGANLIELAAQIIHVDPPPPSAFNKDVPLEIDRITLRALAKRPEDRYQSADEMIVDLRATRARLPATDRQRAEQLKYQSSASLSFLSSNGRLNVAESMKARLHRRPVLTVASVLVTITLVSLLTWSVMRWWYFSPYTPSPEAVVWYDRGTDALRDGTPYRASRMLESAIEIDKGYALAYARLAEAWAEMDYTGRARDARDKILRVAILVPDRSTLHSTDTLYLEAVSATVGRDFPRAITAYREIVRRAPTDAHALVDLGRALEKNEQTDDAIRSYAEATQHAPGYPTAFLRLGVLYARQQNLEAATAALNQAETLYDALGNIEGRTEAIYQRAIMWHDMGRITDARAEFERVLEAARTTGNEAQQINALLRLSDISISQGDMTQAQTLARQAVEFAQARGLENLATRGLIKLGDSFLWTGEYTEAERVYRQALEIAERNEGRYNAARSLMQLGSLRIQQRRPDEALQFIEPALTFFQEANYRKYVALSLTLRARANRQQGRFAVALEMLQRGLQLAVETGDEQQIALSHGEIGEVLAEQENYPQALTHYRESLAINRRIGNVLSAAYNLRYCAEMLWRLGHYAEARTALDEAATMATRSGDAYRPLLIEIELSRAAMSFSERRLTEAAASSQQVLRMAGDSGGGYTTETSTAKSLLGRGRARSGATREAIALCTQAVEIARAANDETLLAQMLLNLAETTLESGDARNALDIARQAAETFTRLGQQESNWRAHLVAARASRMVNGVNDNDATRAFATRTTELLSQLQQEWGDDNYNVYATRPDIRFYLRQLAEVRSEV